METRNERRSASTVGATVSSMPTADANHSPSLGADRPDALTPPPVTRPDWVLPTWLRIPRLEAVLGCGLGELDWATLQGLVDRGVEEDLSIEFKATDYDSAVDDGEKRAFEAPKDVAAFANASGGLIVIGMSEKAGGVAAGFSKQRPDETTRRNLITTLLDGLAPFVADIQTGLIANPDGTGEGCLLVLVPPSDSTPHAVSSHARDQKKRATHSMSWPVREGSRTRWLREPELAERYRNRFTGYQAVQTRVEQVIDEGMESLDLSTGVWLAVASAPTRPAPRRLLTAALRDSVAQVSAPGGLPGSPLNGFSSQASFGAGRVMLSNVHGTSTLSTDHHIEVHTDGSVFAALHLGGSVDSQLVRHVGIGIDPANLRSLDVADVAGWCTALIHLTASHSIDLGASGDFEMRLRLVCSNTTAALPVGRPERRVEATILTEPYDGAFTRLVPNSRPVTDFRSIALTGSPLVTVSPRDLLQIGAAAAHEVYAQFGQLPSEPILDPDGYVYTSGCQSPRTQTLRDWAEQHGLAI